MNPLLIELSEIEKKKVDLVGQLTKLISELPENTETEKLSGGAFTVKFSTIMANKGNLSPHFYDFKFQYGTVSEKLLLAENPIAALQKIVLEKRVIRSGTNYTLHDEVINNLKKLL